jgi:hypothetical protein
MSQRCQKLTWWALPLAHTKKKAPRKRGLFLSCARLVIAHAIVIATPPIGASGDEGLTAQPPAIVVGVTGTVNPDPDAVPKYPVTMMEAVKMVVAPREAAVLEPIATVVALNETITMPVALCESRSTASRPSVATAAAAAHLRATSAAAHYFRTTSAAAPSATVTTAMAATVTTAVLHECHCATGAESAFSRRGQAN